MRNDEAFANLLEMKEVLDELGIVYWLDGGTILGAHRDKDFCEDDEDDIDLASWANYQHAIPNIIEGMTKKGYDVHMWWQGDDRAKNRAQEVAFVKNNLKIDLFFYEKSGHLAWAGTYDSPTTLIPQVVPAHFFELLDEIDFRGTKFNVPKDIEGYLTYRYGDWKTKIHSSQHSCYNPEQLLSLKPDFKFYQQD
jgi:phosphorylcholine metabolism protein LicD